MLFVNSPWLREGVISAVLSLKSRPPSHNALRRNIVVGKLTGEKLQRSEQTCVPGRLKNTRQKGDSRSEEGESADDRNGQADAQRHCAGLPPRAWYVPETATSELVDFLKYTTLLSLERIFFSMFYPASDRQSFVEQCVRVSLLSTGSLYIWNTKDERKKKSLR